MEDREIVEGLHPLEKKVLGVLKDNDSAENAAQRAGMLPIEAMRAYQWLQNKGLVTLHEDLHEEIRLGKNGQTYKLNGLPETNILNALSETPIPASQLLTKAKVSMDEINAVLGILKKINAINIIKKDELLFSITPEGIKIRLNPFDEEKLLKHEFPLSTKEIKPEEKLVLEGLKKRKDMLSVELVKTLRAVFTPLGKRLLKNAEILKTDTVDRVTKDLLISKDWKKKTFRRYDVSVNVPRVYGGKKQHYRKFLDEVRTKFLSLGFTEMEGPIVETDFWNMDALFMPQFHSARDIHQGYYIKEPKYAKALPENIVKNVKAAHENGFGTGSKGWQYDFDVKRTHRHILITHDTCVSARTLASKQLKIPGKYFQISRCFRYDVVDATHLPDFNQVGGFVIEEGINFGHLKSLLRMFAEEFAESDEIRIKPSYFPFTEPSAELQAKHPEFGWIELAGAGIFRPELVKPLVGREVPVIAWGVGLDRLAMFKLGIKDIRLLFSHDLEFLRNVKVI